MKRIIALVFLGLLIYASIFVIVYGVDDVVSSLSTPVTLDGYISVGNTVDDTLDTVIGHLSTKNIRNGILGTLFNDPIVRHYYVIPIGKEPNYMVIAVTDPDDVEAIENIKSGGEFPLTGRIYEMDYNVREDLTHYLMANPHLIGEKAENQVYIIEMLARGRIAPYVIDVCDIGPPNYATLIIGAALFILGAGLAALLIVKIVREKTGY